MSNESPTLVVTDNAGLTPREERRVYDAASDRVRRYVMALLRERNRPVEPEELATHVAAWRGEKPLRRVSDEEHRDALAALHHRHLPKLEEVGLLRRDADGCVAATDRSLLRRAGLAGAFETDPGDDQGDVNRLFDVLADPERRTLLDVLDDRPDGDFPLSIGAVAEAVVERSDRRGDVRSTDGGRERLLLALHHRHLPKLADAGVVDYDPQERTVTFEGLPALPEEWS